MDATVGRTFASFGSDDTQRQRLLVNARRAAWKTLTMPVHVAFQGSARDRHATELRELWNEARGNGCLLDFERVVFEEVERWLAGVQVRESA